MVKLIKTCPHCGGDISAVIGGKEKKKSIANRKKMIEEIRNLIKEIKK